MIRTALRGLFVGALWVFVAVSATANDRTQFQHGVSFFGDFKYPPDFAHFDFVDPDAPKGGRVVYGIRGTFDSFTPLIRKGIRPAGMAIVGKWQFLYDRLLEYSDDEAGVHYSRLAESIAVSEDFTRVRVRLRTDAYWHDGTPITVKDVLFTHRTLRDHATPAVRAAWRHIYKSEQTGPNEVTFYVNPRAALNPTVAITIGHIYVIPEHYWREHDITKTTLEPPLGSGPYRIGEFIPGQRIVWERVENYWGEKLPVNVGRHNFDQIVFEYFRDDNIAREALKKGLVDFRFENGAKEWSTAYDIPAREKGWFKLELFRHADNRGMPGGLFFNTRKSKLSDPRVREALMWAFDFEWSNRVISYDFYARASSYFQDSYLQAKGLPSADEIALLAPFRDSLPARLFTEPYPIPHTNGRGQNRDQLKHALELFADAGWYLDNGRLIQGETGRPFVLEILLTNPSLERAMLPYAATLRRIGIEATVKTVESSRYRNLVRNFEFDAAYKRYWATLTPSVEIRAFFDSVTASQPFTENIAGIKSAATDAMIATVLTAREKRQLLAAGRALDRTLLWGFYAIPLGYPPGTRMVYWDKFGRPETPGQYREGFPDTWWIDAAREARIKAGLAQLDAGD
jgi:microcin C transport system substrate-binding protein